MDGLLVIRWWCGYWIIVDHFLHQKFSPPRISTVTTITQHESIHPFFPEKTCEQALLVSGNPLSPRSSSSWSLETIGALLFLCHVVLIRKNRGKKKFISYFRSAQYESSLFPWKWSWIIKSFGFYLSISGLSTSAPPPISIDLYFCVLVYVRERMSKSKFIDPTATTTQSSWWTIVIPTCPNGAGFVIL